CMYASAAMESTWAWATTSFALAGASEACSVFWSVAVFFRSMLSLLYDSVMSSSWFDAVSICFLSSLSDGAACAAVAMDPVIASATAATTRDRSLVRGVGTGVLAFLPLRRRPGQLAPGFSEAQWAGRRPYRCRGFTPGNAVPRLCRDAKRCPGGGRP